MYMLFATKVLLLAVKIRADEAEPVTAIPLLFLSKERYCALILVSCRRAKSGGVVWTRSLNPVPVGTIGSFVVIELAEVLKLFPRVELAGGYPSLKSVKIQL